MVKSAHPKPHQVASNQSRRWVVPFSIWFSIVAVSLAASVVMVRHLIPNPFWEDKLWLSRRVLASGRRPWVAPVC